jgi:hypothetical protein
VTIQSTATSSITDTDSTDNDGLLEVIGVSPGVGVYHVTATKSGYTSDQTSPDANVLKGQTTQVNLSIDKLSALNISSVGPTCSPIGNFHFNMTGTKLLGGAVKYSHDLVTDSSGSLLLSSMEPDTYLVSPKDANHDIDGITPFSPFKLNPGNTQTVQIVVVPANENSLMVTVKDDGTGQPLSGAVVELSGPNGYDQTQVTGQGYFDQIDWSDGATQPGTFSDVSAYAVGSGVDTSTSSGSILLFNMIVDPNHPYDTNATGTLESSTFDTGTTSNFYSLNWLPATQPLLAGNAPVKFQFATAASSTGPWNYVGPDGSSGMYYTVPGTQISFPNGGNEFARYKAFMTTQTATVTPSINDVSFTYTSGCIPPGQVLFRGLSASSGGYSLSVIEPGYTTGTVHSMNIISGWQSQTVQLQSGS